MTSQLFFDPHYKVVINCAKFDVCTPSIFRAVKTDRHTDRFAVRLVGSADVVVVVVRPLPRDGNMAEDHGAPEAGKLSRAWTRGRRETKSLQKMSCAKSP